MLSFVLTNELTLALRKLDALAAKQWATLQEYPQLTRDAIHQFARISSIGASTRIENAILTDAEIEWIDTVLTRDGKPSAFAAHQHHIKNKLSKDRERSIEEVAGCRSILHIIYEQADSLSPLTERSVRGLHQELMHYYTKAKQPIGQYKTLSNSVIEYHHGTGDSRTVFQTADPGPITQTAMLDLLTWYNQAKLEASWGFAVTCEFVYRFLAIHPFQDGNGRLSRALFLLSLLQDQDSPLHHLAPYLAIDREVERRKSEYYAVLNRCSKGRFHPDPKKYAIEHFLSFMLKVVTDSLKGIEHYKTKHDTVQRLSESATQVLACFKEQPETRLDVKTICELTQLPNRTVSYALSNLQKKALIQRYGQGRGTRYQPTF